MISPQIIILVHVKICHPYKICDNFKAFRFPVCHDNTNHFVKIHQCQSIYFSNYCHCSYVINDHPGQTYQWSKVSWVTNKFSFWLRQWQHNLLSISWSVIFPILSSFIVDSKQNSKMSKVSQFAPLLEDHSFRYSDYLFWQFNNFNILDIKNSNFCVI